MELLFRAIPADSGLAFVAVMDGGSDEAQAELAATLKSHTELAVHELHGCLGEAHAIR